MSLLYLQFHLLSHSSCIKRSGVDSTNILRPTNADPKSAKNTAKLSVFLVLFSWSLYVKAAHKMLMKSTTHLSLSPSRSPTFGRTCLRSSGVVSSIFLPSKPLMPRTLVKVNEEQHYDVHIFSFFTSIQIITTSLVTVTNVAIFISNHFLMSPFVGIASSPKHASLDYSSWGNPKTEFSV